MLSHFRHVQLFVIPWTAAHQPPLSMEFFRQEYWSGLSCPSPGDLPNSGIKSTTLTSAALTGRFFTTSTTWEVRWGEVAQSCLTLCDPMDCNLLGFSVHGSLQARILEWVAISFSRGSSWPRDQTRVSRIGGRCFNLWATFPTAPKILSRQIILCLFYQEGKIVSLYLFSLSFIEGGTKNFLFSTGHE